MTTKNSDQRPKRVFNLIIVDESGSMCIIREQAFAGMNETLQTVRQMQMKFGDQEQKVCILTRLGLHNGDIALLLDTSPQRVSNAKMKANLKLFDKQSASNLSDNLKDSEKLSL